LLPAVLLDLTIREFEAYAAGRARRDLIEWRRALFTAWHGAYFVRQKRLPRLKRMMERLGGRGPARSPEDLLKIALAINQALGGTDRRRPRPAPESRMGV